MSKSVNLSTPPAPHAKNVGADGRVLQSKDAPFFGGLNPTAAAFARGLTFAILTAAISFATVFFTDSPPELLAAYAPIFLVVLRTIEGKIDASSLKG